MPLNFEFESNTNYDLQGFGVSFDGKYCVDEVEHHLSAKRGSETRLTLHRVVSHIT